ncbi:hypothetical protein JNK13_06270 [bacterium]|nr:hypothetical protein [bacterium]
MSESELKEALNIIRVLAQGLEPKTQAPLPKSNPCHDPSVVRALMHAASALEKKNQEEVRRKIFPSNLGKAWSREDDEMLLADFSAGQSIADLAVKFSRSERGIVARLVKYKKLHFSALSEFETKQHPFKQQLIRELKTRSA